MNRSGREEILSIQEVAAELKLAVQTLYNMRVKGEGPRMWILRGRVRCYRSDLDAWIAEQSGRQGVVGRGV